MTPLELSAILESLIRITSQRDQHALELCLAQTLFELVAPGGVRLYRTHLEDGGIHFMPIESIGPKARIRARIQSGMRQCLDTGERIVVTGKEGTCTLIYPLKGVKNEVVGLITIEGASGDDNLQHMIGLVLQIYQNFLGLLHDNERDTLTGLLNRKTFDTRVARVLNELQNYGARKGEDAALQHTLAIMDIDHFKRINDKFGHLYGDEVLLLFASQMTRAFRSEDLLFRFGGEEFVVVIRGADIARAGRILERFRQRVEAHRFPQVGQVTISIGATQLVRGDLSGTIVDRADSALYYAKRHGRNRVCLYEELVEKGELKQQTQVIGDIDLF